jgi:carbamoyl-phosphate synthase large subunit
MPYKILTEASGSLVSAYIIKAIQSAGHLAVATDIDPYCHGRHLADDFILMPRHDDPQLWDKISALLKGHEVRVAIPSFDETLMGWAEGKEKFRRQGVHVQLSEADTVRTFQDKWLTYQFFRENDIPTPKTSLGQEFPVIKPRMGRGSGGFQISTHSVDMEGKISQELLAGEEFTVDVFCDRDAYPVYIVPRKRLTVREGKSTAGLVVESPEIAGIVRKICAAIAFAGPINMQCFRLPDNSLSFTEVNPRIAGGMALGFAATENWVSLIVEHFIEGKKIDPKPIRYGLMMQRYYAEVFIPAG